MAVLERNERNPLNYFIDFGFKEQIENVYVWKGWTLIRYVRSDSAELIKGNLVQEFDSVIEAWSFFTKNK